MLTILFPLFDLQFYAKKNARDNNSQGLLTLRLNYLVPRIRLRGGIGPPKPVLGRRSLEACACRLVELGFFSTLNSSSTRGHQDKKIMNQIHYLQVAGTIQKDPMIEN